MYPYFKIEVLFKNVSMTYICVYIYTHAHTYVFLRQVKTDEDYIEFLKSTIYKI